MSLDNTYHNIQNPLDALEEIIFYKKWSCNRANENELIAELKSRLCFYRLYFSWSQEVNAINFTITFDSKVPESKLSSVYELLSLINENLWMGHFDITSKTGILSYRNTFLIKEKSIEYIKLIEDLVYIGISECEKFYPSFQMVLWEGYTPSKAAATCLMETIGQA